MKQENAFRTVNGGLFLATLGALAWTVAIPGAKKGWLLFGLSPIRLTLVILFVLIACLLLWMVLHPKLFLRLLSKLYFKPASQTAFGIILLCLATLFWITLWMPAGNLVSFSDEFTRLRPLLLMIEAIGLAWLLFFNWHILREHWTLPALPRKWLVLAICLLGSGLAFLTVKLTVRAVTAGSITETPGTPITPLQLVLCLFVFGLVRLLTAGKSGEKAPSKATVIAIFVGIWAVTAAVWALTPFPCGVDRPGPYPPFGNCYPQVKDAAYSIGSHYITLGQGVFNHWPTDKPFYMLFLAAGQWLFGPEIAKYLLFQVIVVAAAPAILYLLVRRMAGSAAAVSTALLLVFAGANAIRLNASQGTVNVWFENTEGLTGLLVLLIGLSLFKFFADGQKLHLLLLTGGLLGLATLTRMNPAFILPIVLITLVIVFWKQRRKLFLSLAALLLGFCIVFLPWAASARDANGANFYWSKIEHILHARYTAKTSLRFDRVNGNSLALPLPIHTPDDENTGGSLLFHFVNNELSSLLKLPVNLSLLSLADVTHQPLWRDASQSSFFSGKLSVVNVILLLTDLAVVLAGVWWACKRWKIAGAVPLLLQVGYNLGNAAAQTSGGRYLEPTFWVTLLYFLLGISAIVSAMTKANDPFLMPRTEPAAESPRSRHRLAWGLALALLIFLGALLPLTNLVPDRLATASSQDALARARKALVGGGAMTPAEFTALVSNPRIVVGEGYMYHMRFYDSPVYPGENPGLEMMILGKDYTYVSYSPRFANFKNLQTEDRLIVIGCNYRNTSVDFWGAQELLLRTLIILQVDEKTGQVTVLKAPAANAGCQE